ncbi:hypothetical protein KEM55_002350 [Ascosphaera atra]|nr:hypothetical protein KEM55_002350 [Ascosphaera atra]
MFSTRIAQQSLRGVVSKNPTLFRTSVLRAAVGNVPQIRSAATTPTTVTYKAVPGEESEALKRQRLNRPVSPHLQIYEPQITSILSSLHRITGAVMAGSLYIFGSAYLVSPLLGWHLESGAIAAMVGSMPLLAKIGLKFFAALPFTFHASNGVRHLWWDMGKGFTIPAISKTGWSVVGISVVGALALALS